MKTALILFAHGARDPEWANPMRRVQAAVRQRVTDIPVELAFLEFLIEQGAQKVVILPMFIARGGHLKNEAPEMVAMLRSTYPNVEFSMSGAIGENEIVVQAMATAGLEAAGL